MRKTWIRTFLQLYVIVFSLFFLADMASAQMTGGYPRKLRFSGMIELQYNNYLNEIDTRRSESESEYSNIKQYIRLDVDGYVYHPRLLVFRSSVNFAYTKSLSGVDIKGRDFGYDLIVTALPYRPVSLDLFASRDHYFFEAKTQALPDRTVTNFGARLRMNLEKLKPIRLIRLRYERWIYETEDISEDTKTDEYALSINGLLEKINTNYTLSASLYKTTSPIIDIDSKYLNALSRTSLKKFGPSLIMTLFYTKNEYSTDDYTKELSFGANLDFPPGKRFFHDYRYTYNSTEHYYKGSLLAGTMDRTTEDTYHLLSGSWGYRFSERLIGSLSLDYGKRKLREELEDVFETATFEERGDVEGLSTSLTYRRPLVGLNFETSYRFTLRKDELRDEYTEHWVNLSLKTRKFRLGTAYLTYTFIKSDTESTVFEETEGFAAGLERVEIGERTTDSMIHTFLLGIRGRGLGKYLRRAMWTVEGTYFNVDSDIKRPIRTFEEGDETSIILFENITRKTQQYSMYAQMILPIRNTINLNTRATYTWGKSDSISRSSTILHARLNYLIYRNLTFAGLWRARWDKIDNNPDRRTFDYEAVLEYRRAKFIATLEVYLTSAQEEDVDSFSRRIFLSLKRFL